MKAKVKTAEATRHEAEGLPQGWTVSESATVYGNVATDERVEKIRNLQTNLKFYEEMIEKDMVRKIEITDSWKRVFGCTNPEGIKAMMMAATVELDRQIEKAKWDGEIPPYYETPEYRLAMKVEDGINSFQFDERNFARGICTMHRTLQQRFMNAVRACIIEMAESDTDLRNEAAVRMCRELKPIVEKHYLPFI